MLKDKKIVIVTISLIAVIMIMSSFSTSIATKDDNEGYKGCTESNKKSKACEKNPNTLTCEKCESEFVQKWNACGTDTACRTQAVEDRNDCVSKSNLQCTPENNLIVSFSDPYGTPISNAQCSLALPITYIGYTNELGIIQYNLDEIGSFIVVGCYQKYSQTDICSINKLLEYPYGDDPYDFDPAEVNYYDLHDSGLQGCIVP